MPSGKDTAILDVRGTTDPAAQIAAVIEAGLLPLTIIASCDPVTLLQDSLRSLRWTRQQSGTSWIVDVLPA
ncbi:MAG: hypothetical protein ACI8S6_000225 [Myxococcota bacterium]|jgi:hypothetical protein